MTKSTRNHYELVLNQIGNISDWANVSLEYYNQIVENPGLKNIKFGLRVNENIHGFRDIKASNAEIQKRFDVYALALDEVKQFNEKVKENNRIGNQRGASGPNLSEYLDNGYNLFLNIKKLTHLNYYVIKTIEEATKNTTLLAKRTEERLDVDFIDELFVILILKNLLYKDYENKLTYSNYVSQLSKFLFKPGVNPSQNIINYLTVKTFYNELPITDDKKEVLLSTFGELISQKEKLIMDNLSHIEATIKKLPSDKLEWLQISENVPRLRQANQVEKNSREPFKFKLLNAIECYQRITTSLLFFDWEKLRIGISCDFDWIQHNQRFFIFENFELFIRNTFGDYFFEISPFWASGMPGEDEKEEKEKINEDELLKVDPNARKLSKEEIKSKAKEMLKQEVVRIIDLVDFDKLNVSIEGLVKGSSEAVYLKASVGAGVVGPQLDDRGNPTGTGIAVKRNLETYKKQAKRALKNKKKE